MRRVSCFAALLAAVVVSSPAALEAQEKKGDDAPKPDPAKLRENLAIPDALWARVLDGVDRGAPGPSGTARPIGFTSDEMKFYGGRDHLIRGVENLFRDVRVIPRETGRITDDLLKLGAEGKFDEVLQRCWGLTDMPAGRMFPAVPRDGWGVKWAEKSATPEEVIVAAWTKSGWVRPLEYRTQRTDSISQLPPAVQRLVARLVVGANEASRWCMDADVLAPADTDEALPAALRDPLFRTRGDTVRRTRDTMRGPWTGEEYDQAATREHEAFKMIRSFDAARMAYATQLWAVHTKVGLEEWRDAKVAAADLPAGRWTIATALGPVVVSGSGDDKLDLASMPLATWCVIDLGGKDRWSGAFGASGVSSFASVALALDLGGDDVWDGGDADVALGCGAAGIGAVIDLGGDDLWTVKSDGLGRGLFGTGLLWDVAGNDTYVVKTKWGQGAAHVGVGVLIDSAGNDKYECAEQSQGMGSTRGCGLLLDLAGDDAYVCRDDGNVSELYLNQSVAMAQGCGYGRRADLGDGRSLAGGWGLLVDGAGNDRYHAQVWSQGCGYWWGVGVLEDRGGDDVYENGKYSSGAGAHYAIGVHVDLDGNDRYNQGVAGTKNQYQGHARDGSIGVFVDGGGNDAYAFRPNCAGSADLASVGLFWDRAGDDTYAFTPDPPPADGSAANTDWLRPPFGTATVYRAANRSFRDDQASIGIFLDTGGKDAYPEGTAAKDGSVWREHPWAMSWGFGLDE